MEMARRYLERFIHGIAHVLDIAGNYRKISTPDPKSPYEINRELQNQWIEFNKKANRECRIRIVPAR